MKYEIVMTRSGFFTAVLPDGTQVGRWSVRPTPHQVLATLSRPPAPKRPRRPELPKPPKPPAAPAAPDLQAALNDAFDAPYA